MNQNENLTLDQKLKAIEIAVAMLGPVKLPARPEDDSEASEAEVVKMLKRYSQAATAILHAANTMREP